MPCGLRDLMEESNENRNPVRVPQFRATNIKIKLLLCAKESTRFKNKTSPYRSMLLKCRKEKYLAMMIQTA